MDLLTKYRPVKSLEFYQRKVIRFIYSSEGNDDLRSFGIPYGTLGFDSPLHFIRCIPPEFCEEFVCDKLFQKVDKTLRKGNRIFLTSDDGKIQSGVYKGQRETNDGKQEAILDGHRITYPLENVVPYKAFLRKNVGAMLINGPHKVVGANVHYEESNWDVGDSIYYKPSKRWGVIQDRDIVRGKVFVEVKLEKSKVKKEKLLRLNLWELMADSVPYRRPIIPKNNENAKALEKEMAVVKAQEKVSSQQLPPPMKHRGKHNDSINRNRLTSQVSKSESIKDISFRKSSSGESEPSSVVTSPRTMIHENKENAPTPKRLTSNSNSIENGLLIDLQASPVPKSQNNYSDEPRAAVVVRRSNSKGMRPLTEYFHSKSIEAHEDYQTLTSLEGPDLRSKSVNNLDTNLSEEDEEEESTFETYTNSLRRSARNVLAKQLADEAARTSSLQKAQRRKKISLSTDNLDLSANSPVNVPFTSHISILDSEPTTRSYHEVYNSKDKQQQEIKLLVSVSTSANDTSGSDSPPPPIPTSALPPAQEDVPDAYFMQRPMPPRTLSLKENVPRNYENSNFGNGAFSFTPDLISSAPNYGDGIYTNGLPHNSAHSLPKSKTKTSTNEMRSRNQAASLSSYHESRESAVDFPPQFLHHALSVPSFEVTSRPPPPQDQRVVDPPERQMSTMERQRYRKNPSALRAKDLHKVKSVPNFVPEKREEIIVEPPLPQPFNVNNIQSAVGKGRGIQPGYHSCYADVSLFSMFYCSNIFDKILTDPNESDRGMKREIKIILKQKIIKPLRLSAFCSWESVCHLREAMLPLSSKLNSSFMDAEEFLYLLFENALKIPEFIKYSNGTNDFMHQLIVKPKDRSRCQDINFLFETSMEINNLKLKEVPMPALMLCMPRCNGRLVYYEAIIPNMTLNITNLVDKGPKKCLCEMAATLECALCMKTYGEVSLAYCENCQRMSDQIHYHIGHSPVLVPKHQKNIYLSLMAVICIKNSHYSTFVKTGVEKFAPWLYYEAAPNELPQVQLLDDFGRWLDKLEKEPGKYRELARTHLYLKRIITESHICIYFSPEAVHRSNNGNMESFMI